MPESPRVRLTADVPELGLRKDDAVDVEFGFMGRWLRPAEMTELLLKYSDRIRPMETREAKRA